MVRAVRHASSQSPEETLETFAKERGRDTVEAVLGDGVKRLAPSERANYGRTNRSIHALRDIAAGETLRAEDLAALRTEKLLRPGLHPSWEKKLPGRKTTRFIPAGEGIVAEDLLQ
jgi:sialic acid synthase SpsE